MKESMREKINKDNGNHFQLGNHILNVKEIIGYIFLILAMLIYVLVDKVGFEYSWLGWLFCAVGFSFIVFGIKQGESQ